MQIVYGGYSFEANAFTWRASEYLLQENGVPYARQLTAQVTGLMGSSGQADTATKSLALRQSTRQFGRDLYLKAANGAVLEKLTSGDALVPVRCIAGPVFDGLSGAEFASYRSVSMAFQSIYAVSTGIIVVEKVTTLEYGGGFPTIVWQPALNGAAQKQQTTGRMPYRVIQSGTIKTRNLPATVPGSLFPLTAMTREPLKNITQRNTATGIEYLLSYLYYFESNSPFA